MRALWCLSSLAAVLLLSGCPNFGVVCNPGTNACGAGCADFTSDRRNCGACGSACIAGQICSNSTCLCQTGSTLCDGQCAVLDTDPRNCSMCGMKCGTGQVCESSTCKDSCTLGTSTQCNMSCVNTQTDPNNCGMCGVTCDGVQCHNGHCGYDAVAACFTTGQIVGVNADGTKSPLQALGSGPASLALYGDVILSADGIDDRLYQANADLTAIPRSNQTGHGPAQVVSDPPYAYVVNSISHTLQILVSDAGCPPATIADGGCAFVPLDDGGLGEPLMGDGGCFHPAVTDGGCADTLLDDAGIGPFTFSDGGCFTVPVPQQSFMPCNVGDGGVALVTIGEVDLGANTFPEAVAKTTHFLWVPTNGPAGASGAQGQQVVKVDVSDPTHPTVASTVDLSTINLMTFDGGVAAPRPWTIRTVNGQLYVVLNNLDPVTYNAAGPGLLAVIDPTNANPSVSSVINLNASFCQDPIGLASSGTLVYVSCAGNAIYDTSHNLISTSSSGIVVVDTVSGTVVGNWTPACLADAGTCAPILPGPLTVSGHQLFMGDQSAGRVFVLDVSDGGLNQLETQVQACSVPSTPGFSNVSDLLSLP